MRTHSGQGHSTDCVQLHWPVAFSSPACAACSSMVILHSPFSLMYHNADRRRTIGKITAAMPGMDGDMWTLAQQTLFKLKRMTDSDYDSQKFYFTDENE